MTYAKALDEYEKTRETGIDQDQLCSEPGCQRPWTVNFGRRLCRHHFKAQEEHKASAPPAGWAREVKAKIRRVA